MKTTFDVIFYVLKVTFDVFIDLPDINVPNHTTNNVNMLHDKNFTLNLSYIFYKLKKHLLVQQELLYRM